MKQETLNKTAFKKAFSYTIERARELKYTFTDRAILAIIRAEEAKEGV